MMAFQIELMVALHHQDAAACLFMFAPCEKTAMRIRLVAVSGGDPQVQIVAKKEDVAIGGRDAVEHLEELVFTFRRGLDMGIRDQHQRRRQFFRHRHPSASVSSSTLPRDKSRS